MVKEQWVPSMEPMQIQYVQGERVERKNRRWQGCPALACTGNRIWVASYTGGDREPHPENYCALLYSDDGEHWIDAYLVIRSKTSAQRPIDAEVFRDPRGRLWLVWGQTHNYGPSQPTLHHDGVFGVWAAVCEDPLRANPVFSEPRRLCDGFMRNKPLFLRNGDWAICAYDYRSDSYSLYFSSNEGGTWRYQKGPDKPEKCVHPDEPMMIEKVDGTIWFLARTRWGIAQSFSYDGGRTWSDLENPAIPNPASRFYIGRLRSGRLLMVNHVGFEGRSHLTALLSQDEGMTWKASMLIDGRKNVSYPDVDQDANGRIWMIHDRERTEKGELLLSAFREEDILAATVHTKDSFLRRVISSVKA